MRIIPIADMHNKLSRAQRPAPASSVRVCLCALHILPITAHTHARHKNRLHVCVLRTHPQHALTHDAHDGTRTYRAHRSTRIPCVRVCVPHVCGPVRSRSVLSCARTRRTGRAVRRLDGCVACVFVGCCCLCTWVCFRTGGQVFALSRWYPLKCCCC